MVPILLLLILAFFVMRVINRMSVQGRILQRKPKGGPDWNQRKQYLDVMTLFTEDGILVIKIPEEGWCSVYTNVVLYGIDEIKDYIVKKYGLYMIA